MEKVVFVDVELLCNLCRLLACHATHCHVCGLKDDSSDARGCEEGYVIVVGVEHEYRLLSRSRCWTLFSISVCADTLLVIVPVFERNRVEYSIYRVFPIVYFALVGGASAFRRPVSASANLLLKFLVKLPHVLSNSYRFPFPSTPDLAIPLV
jgi:hypothetical protein